MGTGTGEIVRIDASGLHYRDLNRAIRAAAQAGARRVEVEGVLGQRFICAGLKADVEVVIRGVPGNDLGVFMDGPRIEVLGNAQDGVGNTMNAGRIAIHGRAGDVLGYGMRGGRVLVREGVGYRVGIHMKEFRGRVPELVVGESARNFLAEYMAGGRLVVLGLGLPPGTSPVGRYVGSGMHGGALYIRGAVEADQFGLEVGEEELDQEDLAFLEDVLIDYQETFGRDVTGVRPAEFRKFVAKSHRPYGRLYAY